MPIGSIQSPSQQLAESIAQKQALWAPTYAGVDQIIKMVENNRALQVCFGDPNHENSPTAPTTTTTRGAEQVVFTYTNSHNIRNLRLMTGSPGNLFNRKGQKFYM